MLTPDVPVQAHSPSTEHVYQERETYFGFFSKLRFPLQLPTDSHHWAQHSFSSLYSLYPSSDKFALTLLVKLSESDFVYPAAALMCKNTLLDIQCTSPSAYYTSSLPAWT